MYQCSRSDSGRKEAGRGERRWTQHVAQGFGRCGHARFVFKDSQVRCVPTPALSLPPWCLMLRVFIFYTFLFSTSSLASIQELNFTVVGRACAHAHMHTRTHARSLLAPLPVLLCAGFCTPWWLQEAHWHELCHSGNKLPPNYLVEIGARHLRVTPQIFVCLVDVVSWTNFIVT